MGYAIIWVSSLAAALFLVATAVAISARLKRRWVRVLAQACVALPALAWGVAATVFAGFLRARGIRQSWFAVESGLKSVPDGTGIAWPLSRTSSIFP